MTTQTIVPPTQRQPALLGHSVVLMGGGRGMGLETARRGRAEGADVILTGRDPERLRQAALSVDARSTAASLERFFLDLPAPIDHVMVTAGGASYTRLTEMDLAQAHRSLDEHLWLALQAARAAAGRMRPGGTLLLMTGTSARRTGVGMAAAMPAITANLALKLALVRVNLIAAGFVDSPLSASLLGKDLEKRRSQIRATLPMGRVVEPAGVAALAVHTMANTARTGAPYDTDGGGQLVTGTASRINCVMAVDSLAPGSCDDNRGNDLLSGG
jgi:NAD(P)-dependent dehydrogenase (short-subunit alcohol dehydrogenase family)